MKKYLTFVDSTSDKFWKIEVNKQIFTIVYGKKGANGTMLTKSFTSEEECLSVAEKLVEEKLKKGYEDPTNPSLTIAQKEKTQNAKKTNIAEILAEYDDIIKNRKIADLLPFLKEKSKGNVVVLKKHVKKAKRYWMTYVNLANELQFRKNYDWGTRGDVLQAKIIVLSAIALFDKTEIASWEEPVQHFSEYSFDGHLFDILEWAKPQWIDTYLLDRLKKQPWWYLDYSLLRGFEEKGILNYNPELYALTIPFLPHNQLAKKIYPQTQNYIDALLDDTVAVERDIPLLFQYQTIIHNIHFYDDVKTPKAAISFWQKVFERLLVENKMDRAFFIENALQIQTKDWNNNLKTFFRDRLKELAITNEEWAQNQETVFSFLHAPLPALVNYGIACIKTFYTDSSFDILSFLAWLPPMMMRADAKTAIQNVLSILEKIAKSHPQYIQAIALVVADIFVISDLTLQEKAAKLLLKIADKNDPDLQEKLAIYAPQLQGTVKNTLQDFFLTADFQENTTEIYAFEPYKKALLTQKIVLPQTWNEILFLFGKFIQSDDILDGEILVNSFICQKHLFPIDFVGQLQPYKRQLEHKYYDGVAKNDIVNFLDVQIHHPTYPFSGKRSSYNSLKSLNIMGEVMNLAHKKSRKENPLPLLCFPSHAPYWVAPKVLIQRLIDYQNAQENINLLDLSIAIARMPQEQVEEAIPLLEKLEPEMKELMGFCLGLHKTIEIEEDSIFSKVVSYLVKSQKVSKNSTLWALAARTYYPTETFPVFEKTSHAQIPFVVRPFQAPISFKERWHTIYNYQTRKNENSASWYELCIDFPMVVNIPNYLLYSVDLHNIIGGGWWNGHIVTTNNTLAWHSTMPQNPEPLAFRLLKTSCASANGGGNDLLGFLQLTTRPEFWFSDITMLVFACCFFQENKEVRFTASEVLLQQVEAKSLNVAIFGQKIALLMTEKYGVLSRCIDALLALRDISPLHNSALFMLLDSLFQHLNFQDKLPTNFKKLVENYIDMMAKTQEKPSQSALNFLKKWKEVPSLKGLLKAIIK